MLIFNIINHYMAFTWINFLNETYTMKLIMIGKKQVLYLLIYLLLYSILYPNYYYIII
jgi:hypothetical protein